jgi:hypothetical protein
MINQADHAQGLSVYDVSRGLSGRAAIVDCVQWFELAVSPPWNCA